MVAVPREYMPLLDEEVNRLSFFSYPQLMDHILSRYFKGVKKPAKATVREVEPQ